MTYTTLISAAELQPLIDRVLLFDCRARLGDHLWGRQAYLKGHIPGAQHLDLDADLADPPDQRGRHPLPARDRWVAVLRDRGLEPNQQVVVYDDAQGAFAARAWWMLRWVGHEAVAVLDGGLAQWPGPWSTELPRPTPSHFESQSTLTRVIDSDSLHAELANSTLVDARTQARWSGAEEPIDPIAGHIPGAACFPFQDNLDTDGCFKSPDQLRARFESLSSPLICYCGSGVTATHNILATQIAGLDEPILYADSWSGWITDPARPVATQE